MIIESRHASTPFPAVSLGAFVREALQPFADAVALVDGPSGRGYTYRQLLDLSASVANVLATRGIGNGDRVAFVCANIPEVAIGYHGVIAAGAVAMMVNALSTAEELKKYFGVGHPKLVVTIAPLAPAIVAADPTLPLVIIGDVGITGGEPFTALLGGATTPPLVTIAPDDLAVMPYSSGTTGFPKGVMLTSATSMPKETSSSSTA